jgi:hypothetical protein
LRVCPCTRFTTKKVGVTVTLAPSSLQKLGSQPKLADSSSGLNCAGAGAGAAGFTRAAGCTCVAGLVPAEGPVALAGAEARPRCGTISAPPTATAAAPEAITRAAHCRRRPAFLAASMLMRDGGSGSAATSASSVRPA